METNLDKLLQKIEEDPELNALAQLDDEMKGILKKLGEDEITTDEAIEMFIKKQQK